MVFYKHRYLKRQNIDSNIYWVCSDIFQTLWKVFPRYFQNDELALYISRINGKTKLSFLIWAICYIYWNNLLIHVMNYSNVMYKRDLLLSSYLVLLLLWSIVMQNIKDKLRGSVINKVQLSSLLIVGLGFTDISEKKCYEKILEKIISNSWERPLNDQPKKWRTGRQQLFHRTFFFTVVRYTKLDHSCSRICCWFILTQVAFIIKPCLIVSFNLEFSQTSVKDLHILFSNFHNHYVHHYQKLLRLLKPNWHSLI